MVLVNKSSVLILLIQFILYSCATNYEPIDVKTDNGKDIIKSVLLESRFEYKICYEQHLFDEGSKINGIIKTKFEIVKDGSVSRVEVNGLDDTELKKCLIDKLRNTKFPSLKNTDRLEVKQDFNFFVGET